MRQGWVRYHFWCNLRHHLGCLIHVRLLKERYMAHPIYREPPSPELLCQGDILDSECLRENLRGHQDYFAEHPRFYRYMVLTQTCDLARGKDRADFIFLAVIKRLKEAIGIRQI